MDCRPVSVVEDRGLLETLQIASSEASYKPPSRSTIVSRIQQLYDQERILKINVVAGAKYIALTGDHWTSVSNHNYLGVTAHVIDSEWKLQSFALAMLKNETRHYANARADSLCRWRRHGKYNEMSPQLAQTVPETWSLLRKSYRSSTCHVLLI